MNGIWQTPFILFAMQPDTIIYDTFNSVIGFPFFRNCCGLSPFGSNVISPSFCGEDRLSFLKLSFIACTFQKLKKFNCKPVPGTSLFHIKEQTKQQQQSKNINNIYKKLFLKIIIQDATTDGQYSYRQILRWWRARQH